MFLCNCIGGKSTNYKALAINDNDSCSTFSGYNFQAGLQIKALYDELNPDWVPNHKVGHVTVRDMDAYDRLQARRRHVINTCMHDVSDETDESK